ncbi:butyrophilin subfamily 2 member A1-like [Perca flavescens]|uniref:butyrophilin subfamily 2 member A1-like n=1 Tax=Perca flavescens TaxID=8167 RepID=UPI00106E2664|nr:butyrophilin subfamily 2 member A1-like [Perca flavescens]
MAPAGSLLLLWALTTAAASNDTKNITAKPGEDVPLRCQAPRGADIALIEWNRPDLESRKYVFFLRENSPNEKYQLPSYRGRVNQRDPEMKDGDVSVVLKNVSVNDSGTYECRVGIGGRDTPKLYSTIQLNVSVSGHTAGDKGDKDGGDKDGGDINRHYGLIAALPVVVVVVGMIVLFILWVRKRPQNNNPADEEGGPRQDTLLDQRPINNNFTDAEATGCTRYHRRQTSSGG